MNISERHQLEYWYSLFLLYNGCNIFSFLVIWTYFWSFLQKYLKAAKIKIAQVNQRTSNLTPEIIVLYYMYHKHIRVAAVMEQLPSIPVLNRIWHKTLEFHKLILQVVNFFYHFWNEIKINHSRIFSGSEQTNSNKI